MSQPQLIVKDQPERVQTFLFVCAFWAVAADEALRSAEQQWLTEQFGEEMTKRLLDELIALESEDFFVVFDDIAGQLTDDDKRSVYPELRPWIESCFLIDGVHCDSETKVLKELTARISLDTEIERLTGDSGSAEQAGPILDLSEPAPAAEPGASAAGEYSLRALVGHASSVSDVCFLPDGKTIVTASEDRTVKLWDATTGAETRSLEGHETGVCTVVCSSDGSRIISGDRIGVLRIWDALSGAEIHVVSGDRTGGVTGLGISGDGKLLVTSCEAGYVTVRDASDGSSIRKLGMRTGGIMRDACISPDGTRVASGGDDKMVRLWNVDTGEEEHCCEGHEDGVMNVCFSSDGNQLVSCARDNSVRLWDIGSGKELTTLSGHTFTVCGVCFSPDGRVVVSGAYDHTVRLWDAASGREMLSHEHYAGGFTRVAVHPDGIAIAACCEDGTLQYIIFSGGLASVAAAAKA